MALRFAHRLREDRMVRLTNGAHMLDAGSSVVRVEKEGRQLLYILDGGSIRCLTSTGEFPIPQALQGLIKNHYFNSTTEPG